MSEDCLDPTTPTVDNSSMECEELISTNCVVAAESNLYLKYIKGATLTKVLTAIAVAIQKLTTAQTKYLPTYTTYTVALEQSGSGVPTTPIVLNNSKALVPTYTRTDDGDYVLTATGKFADGTYMIISPSNIPTYTLGVEDDLKEFYVAKIDDDSLSIKTALRVAGTATLTDGLLDGVNTIMEIRFYS